MGWNIVGGIEGPQGPVGPEGPEGPEGPAGQTGAPGTTTWAGITDKPTTFPPEAHTHPATGISDSTATGRSVITAATSAAARTAIGAGTSSLAIGTTGSTAKAGNYVPTWTEVTSKPTTFPPVIGSGATDAVAGNDPRLTDARTPTAHTHPATGISDSTVTGRAVVTATDAAAARTAIGAGTSSLAIGTTAGTAKAGDYQPAWTDVTSKPSTFPPTIGSTATTAVAGNDSRLTNSRTPTAHTHPATDVSDSTAVGRAVMTAADAAAARTAIGAAAAGSGATVEVMPIGSLPATGTAGVLYVTY